MVGVITLVTMSLPLRSANASCGDYLYSRGQSVQPHSGEVAVLLVATDALLSSMPAPAPQAPCNGPFCQGDRPTPVVPVPPVLRLAGSGDVMTGESSAAPGPADAARPRPNANAAESRSGYPLRIDMPPER